MRPDDDVDHIPPPPWEKAKRILTPFLRDERSRSTLLEAAFGLDHPLLEQVTFAGPVDHFLGELIPALSRYGRLESGKLPVVALLEEIKVGVDRRAEIGRLCHRFEELERMRKARDIDAEYGSSHWPPGLVNVLPDLRNLLGQLKVTCEDIRQAYELGMRKYPDWVLMPIGRDSILYLLEAVLDLSRILGDGEYVPLLVFIQALADRPGDPEGIKKKLGRWLVRATKAYADPGGPAKLRAVRKQLEEAARAEQGPGGAEDETGRLIIQVEPSQNDPDTYLLKAWLIGVRSEGQLLSADRIAPEAIEAQVRRAYDEAARRCATGNKFKVDFLLACELMSRGIEDYTVQPQDMDRLGPISAINRVVIRSLHRVRDPGSRATLQQRWEAIHPSVSETLRHVEWDPNKPSTQTGQTIAVSIDPAIWRDDSLFLRQCLLDARVGCVILAGDPCPTRKERGILGTLYSGGVPAVIWSRSADQGMIDPKAMIKWLKGKGLSLDGLPDRIWELRKDALYRNKGPRRPPRGCHPVTLLYDEPDRNDAESDVHYDLSSPAPP